jgi:transcriptional regulator with XRE-family HTH domain
MFPKRLEMLRKEKHLSQQKMGELLGITRQGYAKYEKEDSEPDIATINKLASFFGVTTDYLLGKTDKRNGQADHKQLNKQSDINTAFYDFDNLDKFSDQEVLKLQEKIFQELKRRMNTTDRDINSK